MSSEQHDLHGRELAVGDTVLTHFFSPAVVVGFTATKVKLASFHALGGPRVGATTYQADKLLILRAESFEDTPWGEEMKFVRREVGLD